MNNNAMLPSAISACKNSSFSFSVSGWPAVAVVAVIAACYTICKLKSLDYEMQVAAREI